MAINSPLIDELGDKDVVVVVGRRIDVVESVGGNDCRTESRTGKKAKLGVAQGKKRVVGKNNEPDYKFNQHVYQSMYIACSRAGPARSHCLRRRVCQTPLLCTPLACAATPSSSTQDCKSLSGF